MMTNDEFRGILVFCGMLVELVMVGILDVVFGINVVVFIMLVVVMVLVLVILVLVMLVIVIVVVVVVEFTSIDDIVEFTV